MTLIVGFGCYYYIDVIYSYRVFQSKEFETRLKEKKPGNLTDDLRVALGMPVGAVRVHPSGCLWVDQRGGSWP